MTESTTLTTQNRTTTDVLDLDALAHHAPATDDLLALADWLGTNGAAHLSPIERIELAERLITRRRFLIGAGALGLGVITGCGTEEEAAAPTATSASVVYPRTVTDAGGREVVFQKRPERVVIDTYRHLLDELLLLDIAPLGYAAWASEKLPIWTRQTLEERDLMPINFNGQTYPVGINFEQLVAAKPDLIILSAEGGKAENVENFALFEQIAPVFVTDWSSQGYDRLRILAEVFAVEDQVAEIETRDAELLALVTPPPSGVELSVAFGYKDGGVAAQVFNGAGASELVILERAGFTIKDYGRPAGERDFYISEENFALLDADIFWNMAPYPGDRSAEDFETSTIMQNLTVVKEGRYRSLNADQSQAILFWTPLATPFLVETLNELVASYDFA